MATTNMAVRATVRSRGRLRLPEEVMQNLGLKNGDWLDFVLDEGRIALRPSAFGAAQSLLEPLATLGLPAEQRASARGKGATKTRALAVVPSLSRRK